MDTLELPVTTGPPALGDAPVRAAPRHRAPLALRAVIGLIAAGSGLLAIAILLSDGAPGVLRRVFGDTVRSLWERVDADRRATIEATGATSQPDVVVHVLMWSVVAALVALTIWSWRGLLVTAAGVSTVSVVVELGQRRWASTRAFEVSDIAANLVGVGLGVAVAAVAIGVWAGVATLVDRAHGRPHRRLTPFD